MIRVAVVDSRGVVSLQTVQVPSLTGTTETGARKQRKVDSKMTSASNMRNEPTYFADESWAGIKFCPGSDGKFATAHHFGKCISVYDGDRVTRQMYTRHTPTAMAWGKMPNSDKPVIVVTENNVVSLWDDRVAEKRGCVVRIEAGRGTMFSVNAHAEKPLVICGGVEKTVTIVDVRAGSIAGRWIKATKYDIISTMFAKGDNACFVVGLDHEINAGVWITSKSSLKNGPRFNRAGFRGASRWVGVDSIADGSNDEAIVGITESAYVYTLRRPRYLGTDDQ
jgi:hypothetical protein